MHTDIILSYTHMHLYSHTIVTHTQSLTNIHAHSHNTLIHTYELVHTHIHSHTFRHRHTQLTQILVIMCTFRHIPIQTGDRNIYKGVHARELLGSSSGCLMPNPVE